MAFNNNATGTLKTGKLDKWCGYSSVVHLTSAWQSRFVDIRPGIMYIYEKDDVKSAIPLNGTTKIHPSQDLSQFTLTYQRKTVILRSDPFVFASWNEALHKAMMTYDGEMQKIANKVYEDRLIEMSDDDSDAETRPLKMLEELLGVYVRDHERCTKKLKAIIQGLGERYDKKRESLNKTTTVIEVLRALKQAMQYIFEEQTAFYGYKRSAMGQIRAAYVQHDSSMTAVKMLNKELYNTNPVVEMLEEFIQKCECEELQQLKAGALQILSDTNKESDEFFDAESSVLSEEEIERPASEDCGGDGQYREIKSTSIELKPPSIPHVVVRRTTLPRPRTEFKVSLWSILKDTIGRDLSRIALPVTFNEPTSFLQRAAEDFMYASLLDQASSLMGPLKQLNLGSSLEYAGYIAAFMISPYASAFGRTFKPFNPLLGETYELTHRNFNYIAEQVSHHPPAMAYHCEDQNHTWTARGDLSVVTSFTGKSLSVAMKGNYELEVNKKLWRGTRPLMTVDNVIFGKLNVDIFGQSLAFCPETKENILIEYIRPSWWSYDEYNVKALIYGSDGQPRIYMFGDWKTSLMACALPKGLKTLPLVSKDIITNGKRGTYIDVDWQDYKDYMENSIEVWRATPRPVDSAIYYEFSYMSFELNEITPEYDPRNSIIPPTDSRFRTDQRLLEKGYPQESNLEKRRLEEKQRAAARLRKNGENDWKPVWFKKTNDIHPFSDQSWFPYSHSYWEYKDQISNRTAKYEDICPDIY